MLDHYLRVIRKDPGKDKDWAKLTDTEELLVHCGYSKGLMTFDQLFSEYYDCIKEEEDRYVTTDERKELEELMKGLVKKGWYRKFTGKELKERLGL